VVGGEVEYTGKRIEREENYEKQKQRKRNEQDKKKKHTHTHTLNKRRNS